MPRDLNIFYRLAFGENGTTELLCNFLQYSPFRRALFAKLFPGSAYCNDIQYEDIDTQFFAEESGRPDIVVKDSNFCAYIEVKIDENRGTTPNQPTGYLDHLRNGNDRFTEKWLAFLTPKAWIYRTVAEEAIQEFKSKPGMQNVRTSFYSWEDLLCLIEDNDLHRLNIAFADFHKLLVQRYRTEPVKFTHKEITAMFSKEIPDALQKLDKLIEAIEGKCRSYSISRRHRGRHLCPQENGIYFQNENGHDLFFFGEWTDVWTSLGCPLCFGVDKNWKNAEAFKQVYKAFKEVDGWLIGLVPREMLYSDDAVKELWELLDPILRAVVNQDQKLE